MAFSTGPELDTMRVEGRLDRMTRAGKKDLRVMLYNPCSLGFHLGGPSTRCARANRRCGHQSATSVRGSSWALGGRPKQKLQWDEGEYVALDTMRFAAGDTNLQWLGDDTEEVRRRAVPAAGGLYRHGPGRGTCRCRYEESWRH